MTGKKSTSSLVHARELRKAIENLGVADLKKLTVSQTCGGDSSSKAVLGVPLYRISEVDRSDFITVDRHRLAYRNVIEKLNCVFCGYANGVLTYAREIAARTEQYWCPIKHASRILGTHSRYAEFLTTATQTGFMKPRPAFAPNSPARTVRD